MTTRFIQWQGWQAVHCHFNHYELIVGVSAGPRILSFSRNNVANVLYNDATNFGVGDWRLYGGHRFTIAPEHDASYHPDNEACKVVTHGSTLQVWAGQRPDGVQLSMIIGETPDGTGIEIQHLLQNNGAAVWQGALWAITCIPRSAMIAADCSTGEIHFWPGTDPLHWHVVNNRMTVAPGTFRGKAGWFQQPPLLEAVQQNATFSIRAHGVVQPQFCADGGCNTEIFVCSDWAELETLGEMVLLAPGAAACHIQHWRLQPHL